MKGIVVTSTSGITGKGEAKTRLTLICFNKREEKRGGGGGNPAEETEEEADGTRRKQRKDVESQHLAETALSSQGSSPQLDTVRYRKY